MVNRLLATGVLIAMLVPVIATLAPIDPAQVVLALFGWGLAYYGDEVAPLIGIDASSSSVRFIDPVIGQLVGCCCFPDRDYFGRASFAYGEQHVP